MVTKTSTKARTLLELIERISLFRIPRLYVLRVAELQKMTAFELQRAVYQAFGPALLIIRSSAVDEDSSLDSNAGAYESVLGVHTSDAQKLYGACNQVMDSFARNRPLNLRDEVIFQILVENPIMSGVIFTRELNTGAPYYVVNYDDISGLTNTVTSGGGEYSNRTLYIHRSANASVRSERFQRLLNAVRELEVCLGNEPLDIEFAMDKELQPYLLQVRPMVISNKWNGTLSGGIDAEFEGIKATINQRLRPLTGVYGKTTVLGQMPDWNPAEMIGRAPRALAYSMYRTLITDQAWWRARRSMGYAAPEERALMVSLGGQPFIDTRLSFHSYLPQDLPEPISQKLVDLWISNLRLRPELHDKIEFDVAVTAYTFDISERLKLLVGDALDEGETRIYREALHRLTLPLILGEGEGSIDKAMSKIKKLESIQESLRDPGVSTLGSMVEDCIRLGTEPFAVLARHGFIARSLLLSLVKEEVFSSEDLARFHASVRTVASDLVSDIGKLKNGKLSNHVFMTKYGHLRPGTYDILSLRYDQVTEFLSANANDDISVDPGEKVFRLTPSQHRAVLRLLRRENFIGIEPQEVIDYCIAATAGREYGKFVFTRSVSDMLELIANFGEKHGLSRQEMSHVPLNSVMNASNQGLVSSISQYLRSISTHGANRHLVTQAIRLPQVLFDEAGIYVVPFQVTQPNFITDKKVDADALYIDSRAVEQSLNGRILIIENADPGFDWIFSHNIAGLVTKYGGANSHMAIRCAEFGIPAAIGCGEQRFERLVKSRRISLDCSVGLVTPAHKTEASWSSGL